ncbi:MAG: YqiA/YcfP family alpha/beta fold hydrolase [Burkholderiales bacterium]
MLIYLHGFNSSPGSHKAQLLKRYMEERGLGDHYCCPALPTLGARAIAAVESEIEQHPRESITLVGSSLGGFYSSYLAERHDLRAVLINPAVFPHEGLRPYLGIQRNLHTQRPYELTEEHLRQWEKLYLPSVRPQRYLLLLETGDEVLDYRQAVQKYAGARQIVIEGGDHSLMSFAEHIPLILEFAGLARAC